MRIGLKSRPLRVFLAAGLLGACGLLTAWVALAEETRRTSLVSTGPASTDGVGEPYFDDASDDGSRIFFETDEQLLAADTDSAYDVYERAGDAIALVSIGPAGGNGPGPSYEAVSSADGSVVFFESRESLVAADDDSAEDVYRREGGTIELVSAGSAGNGSAPAFLSSISPDGSRALFGTEDALDAADEDAYPDVYEWSNGTTALATPGTAASVELLEASEDGSVLFLWTEEALSGADTDGFYDIYKREGGAYELISIGPDGGNAPFTFPLFQAASADGSRAFFVTEESLLAADTDGKNDVYERSGGVTTLLSIGPTGGNAETGAFFSGINADGTRVFFGTTEALVAADVNPHSDVYERSGGVTTLVSTGSDNSSHFVAISADGSRILIESEAALTPEDEDSAATDVYEISAGEATLLTPGTDDGDAYFFAASRDASRVLIETGSQASPDDLDGGFDDVYEAFGGELTLLSGGPEGDNSPTNAYADWIAPEGVGTAFRTTESLLAADGDELEDLYFSGLAEPQAPEPELGPEAPAAASVGPLEIAASPVVRCFGKPATIVGSGRRDVLKGTAKRDVIVARGGNDKILGRGGNDLICAGGGKDLVKAGGGKDRVSGGGGSDSIFGQGGADLLFGNGGGDLLHGGADRDKCRGGAGRDRQRQCER